MKKGIVIAFAISLVIVQIVRESIGPTGDAQTALAAATPDPREARDGFQLPVPYVPGKAGLSYKDPRRNGYGMLYYHPGSDFNQPDDKPAAWDLGKPVLAAGKGIVVYVSQANGIVLRHLWRGQTFYTSYRHVQRIPPDLQVGASVQKGQHIAEVGMVGADSPHLHFEVRNAQHPFPEEDNYGFDCECWRYRIGLMGEIKNLEVWYEDPLTFIATHGAY